MLLSMAKSEVALHKVTKSKSTQTSKSRRRILEAKFLKTPLQCLTPEPSLKGDLEESATPDPIQQIFDQFPRHTTSFRKLFESLQARQWYPIDHVPAEVKMLGLNTPMLIPAEKCWNEGQSPSLQDIYAYCVDKLDSCYTTVEAKGQPSRSRTLGNVLYQLLQPPDESPMVAHNVPIECKGSLSPDAIPLEQFVPPGEETIYYSVNITPTNTIVDIHFDQGTNGLSIGLGRFSDSPLLKVHKIWFLWPPTEHNLKTFEQLRKSSMLRLLCSQALEHGIIASFGVESGIFLPSGWLHATVTTSGGFLGGITFHSAATVSMASKVTAMDYRLAPYNFNEIIPLYGHALASATDSEDVETVYAAANGWLEIEQSLKQKKFKVSKHRASCAELLRIWEKGKVAAKLNGLSRACTCGWKGQHLGTHFWEEHLKIIRLN